MVVLSCACAPRHGMRHVDTATAHVQHAGVNRSRPMRTRVLRQERSIRTRAEVVKMAIRLFARRGVHATSLNELARSVGMTTGVLYFHFTNKDDIVLAAVEQLHADFERAFAEALTAEFRALDAAEQLRRFFAIGQHFLGTPPEHGVFFGMIAAGAADLDPRVMQALRANLDRYATNIARIIARGQRQGELRADVDPSVFAHLTLGTVVGLYSHMHLFRHAEVQRATIPLLNDLLFGAVVDATGAPRPRRRAAAAVRRARSVRSRGSDTRVRAPRARPRRRAPTARPRCRT